jgi:SAM-dependent methyltransferase
MLPGGPPAFDPRAPTESSDARTAAAFATSWNSVAEGSVYTRDQFLDWLDPVDPATLKGRAVLEMGFGNGSLLYHMGAYGPARLAGIELGDTIARTRHNLRHLPQGMLELHAGDLTTAQLGEFDFVYCIGVLHHLEDPGAGFAAVVRHTRPGGRFHCWVYAREGNAAVMLVVDPIRRIACRLPWWATKYGVALPLAIPYFAYAKGIQALSRQAGPVRSAGVERLVEKLPLAAYSRWIARRPFGFFHHVAFDQLVTPRTRYFSRPEVESLVRHPDVDEASTYIVLRNGNSWKFGGRKKR